MASRGKKKKRSKSTRAADSSQMPPSSASHESSNGKTNAAFERWSEIAWLAALAALFFFLYILKMFAMRAYAGDDGIYLYQAKLMAEGVSPYSGFAMAHPPLQTLFTASLFKIFGYQTLLFRSLPIAWYAVGGAALAVTVRKEIGKVASVAATAVYLFSYEPIRASSHYTGVNMAVALLLLALLAYRRGAVRITAALCVAAVLTRLYAIPGVAAIVLSALVSDPRKGLRLVAWGSGIGVAAVAAVGIWTGFGDMFHNMILYHAQKTPMRPGALPNMKNTVLFHNATTALLFVLSLPVVALSVARAYRDTVRGRSVLGRLRSAVVESNTGLVLLSVWIAVVFMAVLLNMERVWMYYFVPSFPFAAVAAGWLTKIWIDSVKRKQLARALTLFVVFAVGWGLSPLLEMRLNYYEKSMKKTPEERVHTYAWKPGLLPDFFNAAVRAAVWRDTRVIGDRYWSFTYLLWHESRNLDVVDEVVNEIEKNTSPEGEIFGDSGTVPLFALLSRRRIAANEVDTNIQRYRSGNADPLDMIRRIDSPKTEMIIIRPRFGVGGLPELTRLVASRYQMVHSARTSQGTVFYLYKRRS